MNNESVMLNCILCRIVATLRKHSSIGTLCEVIIFYLMPPRPVTLLWNWIDYVKMLCVYTFMRKLSNRDK
jgi:hypothetical protein